MAASQVNDIPEAPVQNRDELRLHREVCAGRVGMSKALPALTPYLEIRHVLVVTAWKDGLAALAIGVAHWPQNLCSGGLLAPQEGQRETSGVAHCPQNFMPAGHCSLQPPS